MATHTMATHFSRYVWASAAIALLVGSTSGGLLAQDALEDLYGSGVHAYFAGRYQDASDSLTTAISGGSKDPRAYYFRAMANVRLGKEAEAKNDMQQGSQLEAADVNQLYPVSRSLERVQGATRLTLEKYRATARAESHLRQQRRDHVRYEKTRRAEEDVLRKPVAGAVESKAAATPADAADAAEPAGDDAADPFAEPVKKPAAKGANKAADADADSADPFADPGDSMPAGDDEAPAADDGSAAEMPADDGAAGDTEPADATTAPDAASMDDAGAADDSGPPTDDAAMPEDDGTSPPVDDMSSDEPAADDGGSAPVAPSPPEGKSLFGVFRKAVGLPADPIGVVKSQTSKQVEEAIPGGGSPPGLGPGGPGPRQGARPFPGPPIDGAEMSKDVSAPGDPFGDDADQPAPPMPVKKPAAADEAFPD